MKKMIISIMSLAFILNFSILASADTITKPHTFQDGDTIYSSEVNENFDVVYDQVNKIGGAINVGSTGNVGIGTSTPDQYSTLHLSEPDSPILVYELSTAPTDQKKWRTYVHPGTEYRIDTINDAHNDAHNVMTMQRSGNVGIGTTDPRSPLNIIGPSFDYSSLGSLYPVNYDVLQINNNSTLDDNSYDPNKVVVFTLSSGPHSDAHIIAGQEISYWGSFLAFITRDGNNSGVGSVKERMRITNTGNVGIGTISPKNKLHVKGGGVRIDYDQTYQWEDENGDVNVSISSNSDNDLRFSAGNGERVRISANGNVGIGTSNPITTLHVAGTITEASDARLKKNIKPIQSSLEKITQIKGVSFEWKKDSDKNNHENLGVIAQDVEKVFPELVYTENDKEGTKAVNYNGFVAPLIEAIKEQQKQIAELKKEITKLKSDIAASNQKKKDNFMAYTDGLSFE